MSPLKVLFCCLLCLLSVLAATDRIRADENGCSNSFVSFQGGRFLMNAEKHFFNSGVQGKRVNVNPFQITRFEITAHEYKLFLKSTETGEYNCGNNDVAVRKHWGCFPQARVSWYCAMEYCRSIGARLPSEKEWEYAARYNKDNTALVSDRYNADFVPRSLRDVRKLKVAANGLSGMTGSVWEWTNDWYQGPSRGGASQNSGRGLWKIVKGGSYRNAGIDDLLSPSLTNMTEPLSELPHLGFRCVKDLP